VSSQRSLQVAADEHTLFTVAVLLFYESALGSEELENDRECSWRWRDWSRAFLQESSITELAPGSLVQWTQPLSFKYFLVVIYGYTINFLYASIITEI